MAHLQRRTRPATSRQDDSGGVRSEHFIDERIQQMIGSLHVGLAALGAAIAVGLIGMKASEAVGRNPGSSTKVLVQSILAIAFAEAIVFYTLFLVQ
jgi:F-type H+-transporting ATPase subunit c